MDYGGQSWEYGKDFLTGGLDGDVFEFDRIAESGRVAGTRDVITDFHRGEDVIDLFGIDANLRAGGDQAFTFLGRSQFHGIAGELRAVKLNFAGTSHDKTIVEGDSNGDGQADFSIDVRGNIVLGAGDFIL